MPALRSRQATAYDVLKCSKEGFLTSHYGPLHRIGIRGPQQMVDFTAVQAGAQQVVCYLCVHHGGHSVNRFH